jgi:CBS domain-containing protein
MTKKVDIISADDTIEQAARKMKLSDVGNLPVIMDNEAVGIVTDRDIVLRTVAPGFDLADTKVSQAMTKGVVVCREDDDIEIAARMMGSRRVRRLPVVNSAGELAGIVSLGDLAQKLDFAVTGEMLEFILH